MNKKQEFIAQIRLREIEALDKDTTNLTFRILFGFCAVFVALLTAGVVNLSLLSIGIFSGCILLSVYLGEQANKHILDSYDVLVDSIKRGEVENFKLVPITLFESFYYKKRFS